jgi:large subunit ribosomal protein L17
MQVLGGVSDTHPNPKESRSPEADDETFVAPTSILPKLFTTLAQRYATRDGGYTRVQRLDRRVGDNAPTAIVCLVDGPRDVKFEQMARVVGREAARLGAEQGLEHPISPSDWDQLSINTRKSVENVLQFRETAAKTQFVRRALRYGVGIPSWRVWVG